jgi:hypothetical protein
LASGPSDAVERELGGRRAADAHLVLEPGDGKARAGSVSTTKALIRRWRRRFRVADREDHHVVGDGALADEALRTADAVAAVGLLLRAVRTAAASEPASASVRANAIRRSPDASAGTKRSQLGFGAGEQEGQCAQLLDGEDQAGRGAGG